MYSPSGHPWCRWVSIFIRFGEILCSEWVPSEWESKQLIKLSQVTHTTPVHQLMSCEPNSCVFVTNVSRHFYFKLFRRESCTDQALFINCNSPKPFIINIVMFLSAVWTLILTARIHFRVIRAERYIEFVRYINIFYKRYGMKRYRRVWYERVWEK